MLLLIISGIDAFTLNEGEKSPAIIMKATNGDIFNPAKTGKSKIIILSFFSSDCLPCIKEIPELQKLQNENTCIAIYLVADVSTDEKKTKDFMEKVEKNSGIEITLPVVYDVYSDMKQLFKVNAYPALFLVDKQSIIALRFDGYRQENIEKLKESVKGFK